MRFNFDSAGSCRLSFIQLLLELQLETSLGFSARSPVFDGEDWEHGREQKDNPNRYHEVWHPTNAVA